MLEGSTRIRTSPLLCQAPVCFDSAQLGGRLPTHPSGGIMGSRCGKGPFGGRGTICMAAVTSLSGLRAFSPSLATSGAAETSSSPPFAMSQYMISLWACSQICVSTQHEVAKRTNHTASSQYHQDRTAQPIYTSFGSAPVRQPSRHGGHS